MDREKCRVLTAGVALVLAAAPVKASLDCTPDQGSMIVRAAFKSIGIQLPYTNDDNRNCGATVRYKESGSGTWIDGHPFSRICDQFLYLIINRIWIIRL